MSFTGITRSSMQPDHALIAPDSHVRSTLPGWTKTMTTILISPQMGARFTQYFALMEKGGASGAAPEGVSRFIYVCEGAGTLTIGKKAGALTAGSYAFLPPDTQHGITATKEMKLLVFEKPYDEVDGVPPPTVVIGHEKSVKATPFLGDKDALLKILLPEIPSFDFAINIFQFQPGGTLPFVEVHVMEHGMLFLEGHGVYRMSEKWYVVGKGDVIWMAPYCAQWFVAAGKTPSRYIYYKDMHRDPTVML
ncbi:(S)-ureidoglycine aminohydrolase [Candidatus Sumerlaeota bacterium]|nr:(S)-ureidoglycine aminohydrolase [Candidatus Sumerlaeota bacterium]